MKSKAEQLKGREHLEYIREQAVAILLKKWNCQSGHWYECIRDALREHREYLIKCVEERKKIESEQIKKCDSCKTLLDDEDIYKYVSYCHSCWKRIYVDSACVHYPVKPRPV